MRGTGTRRRGALAVVAAATLALVAACGGSAGSNASGKITLTWWHNANNDPGRSTFKAVADAYHKAHPNVSFKIVPMQNEQFQTKIPVALRGNDFPDIYQQWGSGSEATQVQSGKLMDITSATSSWISELGTAPSGWQVNGKQYGVPYDLHIVGFWYRTDLFKQAGIDAPPSTMDEFNADVSKLKAAGITAVAAGSKDRWPDAFYWEYFALRECSQDTVVQAIKDQKMSAQCFVKAGEDLKSFLDTNPFQKGFLGTPAQQGAGSSAGLVANGKAAMELQGDWELATMPALTKDKNFADKLGWFPFPAVAGGQGDPHTVLGGGDGFSCTANATSACPDFLKYVSSASVQQKLVTSNTITLPTNPAANASITDPTMKTVLSYLQATKYNQTYFDQALPTEPGQALDSAVADFFAGQGSASALPKSISS
ncbi:MAG TPA: ABC transporter substrate-binding protein [Mycobacteriales bacterium]|nr:ABC transporter substrate-binding protein [Mycobacteriales bacterium]